MFSYHCMTFSCSIVFKIISINGLYNLQNYWYLLVIIHDFPVFFALLCLQKGWSGLHGLKIKIQGISDCLRISPLLNTVLLLGQLNTSRLWVNRSLREPDWNPGANSRSLSSAWVRGPICLHPGHLMFFFTLNVLLSIKSIEKTILDIYKEQFI